MNAEKLNIDFYKGSAVHDVLKRFEFNNEELSIINAAIRTSKSKVPNMKFIQKADELLKGVAKNRKPITSTEKKEISPKELAKTEAMTMKTVKLENDQKRNFGGSDSAFKFLLGIFIAILIFITFFKNSNPINYNTPVTFTQAQELCQQQNKFLPLTSFDFDNNVQQVRPEDSLGYWSAEKKIYYNVSLALKDDDGEKHYARCIDVNGLEYPSIQK